MGRASIREFGAARRGCAAIAALPLLALAAPLVAWRRRAAAARRGDRVSVWLHRATIDGFVRLECGIDVPAHRRGEVTAALGGAVAEAAHRVGATVGCVGIVAGEEPVLVALAPARDVVAARVRETLALGEAHRRPELWVTLPPGSYLAQAVNPYVPFAGSEGEIVGLLRLGKVGHALRAEVEGGGVSVVIALKLYAPRRELRKLFTLARRVLADLPGCVRTR